MGVHAGCTKQLEGGLRPLHSDGDVLLLGEGAQLLEPLGQHEPDDGDVRLHALPAQAQSTAKSGFGRIAQRPAPPLLSASHMDIGAASPSFMLNRPIMSSHGRTGQHMFSK